MIKEYNSSVSTPQMVFLGIDEQNQSGFGHKEYKGAPYFAVDVSPEGSRAEAANKVISAMKAKGLDFLEGRMILSLPAQEGTLFSLIEHIGNQLISGSCGLCASSSHARLECAQPILCRLWSADLVDQRRR